MRGNQPPNRAIVTAEGLSKTFKDFWHRPKVRAVDHITFSIARGEVFGLLGPNGSGKSTTLKMILGLLYPTSGRLEVMGRSARDVSAKERIGYLPEESYLYPYLTADETLAFYARLFKLSQRKRRRRVDELIEMLELGPARNRPVGEFSKGMARRVGLGQALINDPDLIVLDEPTAGLDPIGCRQFKDLIRLLAERGKTVLLSSHLLADVEDVCDRIAILHRGSIVAKGSISELLEERDRCRMTLPALPPEKLKEVLRRLRDIAGSEPHVDHPKRDLEAYFIQVVGHAEEKRPHATGSTRQKGASFLTRSESDD